MTTFRFFVFTALLLFLSGCAYKTKTHTVPLPNILISEDKLKLSVEIPPGIDSPYSSKEFPVFSPASILESQLKTVTNDSLKNVLKTIILSELSPELFQYKLTNVQISKKSTIIYYTIDTVSIKKEIVPIINRHYSRISVNYSTLLPSTKKFPSQEVVSGLYLLYPCKNSTIPKKVNLLPNAPRTYRNGVHRGIDFYVDWGSPVYAVESGEIIRADHNFIEISSEFRKSLLNKTKRTGYTPPDIFEHILLGQSIFIDHGFDILPGYRAVSIYAHLSHINSFIKPGAKVNKGQEIGLSGNSGTEPATRGTREGAHLHWELLLQNKNGETYFGQGLPYEELYPLLNKVFFR